MDLDQLLENNSFDLFAAEVMFSRFTNMIDDYEPLFEPGSLKLPEKIDNRKNKKYKSKIILNAQEIFPGYSQDDLAGLLFDNKALLKKLKFDIDQALKQKQSKYSSDDFIMDDHKQASIVCACLLTRSNNADTDVMNELNKLASGKVNKFTGSTGWIHNNFIGEILRLYESSSSKICPFYSGFNTFTLLSRGNLRHFLELCYKSTRQGGVSIDSNDFVIPQAEQAAAAREASISFVKDIRGLGRYGNKLHSFVLALGSLFSLAHTRKTQSEPEINHFVIGKGNSLTDEEEEFLNEAVKWSILFLEEETKVKSELHVARPQWVLNPIYAPYFLISYRKKRKIELTVNEASTLISGNYDNKKLLIKEYMKRWGLGPEELNMSLFSHLEE